MQEICWIWDPQKAATNAAKHGLSFETAALVFADPYHLSVEDPYLGEERWRTIGQVGPVILFVVHTAPEYDDSLGQEVGRIISARKATRRERQAYEDE